MSSFPFAIMPFVLQLPLPVDPHVDSIVEHARRERFAVIVAPPGSGKTTRIPPALTTIGRTILLQPRRVAARALARRVATGDTLVFLPGAREIERARAELANIDALVLPLHGRLDVDAQERAIAPVARRRVILATNVAETSLTVEGITDVIDSGLQKVLRFDPESGVDHLVTERISLDSAEQRAGRAGRTAPGRATRLWDARDILRPHREPEIRRIDLASTVLDLIAWGGDPHSFDWFEAPPPERLDAAIELLRLL